MLADIDTFPPRLPPGMELVDGPTFDPNRHLQLEMPEKRLPLSDFGYSQEQVKQYASPWAVVEPFRVLSEDGVKAMQAAVDSITPFMTAPDHAGNRIYNCTYRSLFFRDFMRSAEVLGHLGQVFETPIAPLGLVHLHSQVNLGHADPGREIQRWHHDQVGFTMVLSMYDPFAVEGGRFEYYTGTREEGLRYRESGETIPADRLVAPACPPGTACAMQGTAIWHHAQAMPKGGYRASLVQSFAGRDVSSPEPSRTYFTDRSARQESFNPVLTEAARHAAWRARGRLGTLIEELPFTEDRAKIIQALKGAVVDVERMIARMEHGPIPSEDRLGQYAEDDAWQMSEPPYHPGG